jgi:peptidoglycan hydrolase-like protein with peptidoglycan-binding domain
VDPNAPSQQYPPKESFASSLYECEPKSEQLQVGSKGDKVIELQTYLTDLGYGGRLQPEAIDGKFGPHTKDAVMQYQEERMYSGAPMNDKRIDGIVGPKTWEHLCIDAYLWFQDGSYFWKHFPEMAK